MLASQHFQNQTLLPPPLIPLASLYLAQFCPSLLPQLPTLTFAPHHSHVVPSTAEQKTDLVIPLLNTHVAPPHSEWKPKSSPGPHRPDVSRNTAFLISHPTPAPECLELARLLLWLFLRPGMLFPQRPIEQISLPSSSLLKSRPFSEIYPDHPI